MSEDGFNITMRQFLKEVGVTSQREIEKALRKALDGGTLSGETLKATMTLEVPDLHLVHVVEGEIDVQDATRAV
jgi:Family of unknown function (DUF6494)